MRDPAGLTPADAVAEYNRTGAGRKKPIRGKWGRKRAELDALVREAQAKDAAKALARKARRQKTPQTKEDAEKPKRQTVRSASLELLCKVDHYEEKDVRSGPTNTFAEPSPTRRSVGLPYDDILDTIYSMFPGAKTSVACLRWYAVKVRVEEVGYEGLRLPQRRPRVRPHREEAT